MSKLFTVIQGLDAKYKAKWQDQFVSVGRDYLDGIWGRSQQEENKLTSGWKSPTDKRRRMIHVIDGYDVVAIASDKKTANQYDCVFVLGGGIYKRADNKFYPSTFNHSDTFGVLGGQIRVDAAAELFKQQRATTFAFVTGLSRRAAIEHGADAPTGAVVYSDDFIRQLQDGAHGIGQPKIILEGNVFNTFSGIVRVAELTKEKGWKKIAILSSDYHLPRIKQLFDLAKQKHYASAATDFLSAEEIMKQAYPGKFDEIIDSAYASSEGQKRLNSEANGLADIRQSRYHFGEFQTNPRSASLIRNSH